MPGSLSRAATDTSLRGTRHPCGDGLAGDLAFSDVLDVPNAAPAGLGLGGPGNLGFGGLTPGYLISRSALDPEISRLCRVAFSVTLISKDVAFEFGITRDST